MVSLNKKANLVFYQIMAIGFVFFLMVLFLAINLYTKLVLISKSLLGILENICGCTNHWSFASHPFIFSFIILVSLGIAVFLIFACIKIFKLRKVTNKFISFNLRKRKHNLSPKLEKAARAVGLADKIIEIKTQEPIIFCFGFLKPQICISQAVVKKLNIKELTAVLAHERHHLYVHEPARIFITKIITKILFFMPGLKLLHKNYLTLSELAADEWASRGFKHKLFLARALEKIMRLKEQAALRDNLAVSFFSIIDERVNKLVNDSYMPQLKSFTLKSLVWFIIISVFIISFYLPVHSTESAAISHLRGSCSHSENSLNNRCQMSSTKPVCLMDKNGWEDKFFVCDELNLN